MPYTVKALVRHRRGNLNNPQPRKQFTRESDAFVVCLYHPILTMAQMMGGPSAEKPADDEIKAICEELKEDILKAAKKAEDLFQVICYTSQVVAGTNFFVKIQTAENEFIHARIFRPLPHTGAKSELHSVQTDKKREDAVAHF